MPRSKSTFSISSTFCDYTNTTGPEHARSSLALRPRDSSSTISINGSVVKELASIDFRCFGQPIHDSQRPILAEILTTLGKTVAPGGTYLYSIMGLVCEELEVRPRKGQLPFTAPNGTRRPLSLRCHAILGAIPPDYFRPSSATATLKDADRLKVELDRFLDGVLKLLSSDPADAVLPLHDACKPTVRAPDGQKICSHPSRLLTERATIDLSMDNSDDQSSSDTPSGSDSTPPPYRRNKDLQRQFSFAHNVAEKSPVDLLFNTGYTPLLSRPEGLQKGKQRELSPPREHGFLGRHRLGSSESRASGITIKQEGEKEPENSNGKKKKQGTILGEKVKKKKKRPATEVDEPEAHQRAPKRPALEAAELVDRAGSTSCEETTIPMRSRKRRDPMQTVIKDLQSDIVFFKNMFLLGGGIGEADVLAYKVRVQQMGQNHKQAWETMFGVRTTRPASGSSPTGGKNGQRRPVAVTSRN